MNKEFKRGYIEGRKDRSMRFRDYIKSNWKRCLWWFFFGYALIDIIYYIDTLQRWKWGYWSIDLIPSLIILIILYFVNNNWRISKLESKVGI